MVHRDPLGKRERDYRGRFQRQRNRPGACGKHQRDRASLPVQTVTVSQARAGIGIEDPATSAIGIYPNPTKGIFRIVVGSGKPTDMEVKVQDLKGEMILWKKLSGDKEYIINLSTAPDGGYHIIIRMNDQVIVRKLMIIK